MKQTVSYGGLEFSPYISKEAIQEKVKEIASFLDERLEGKDPIFLGVLNGCFVFMADLIRACNIEHEVRFVKISSYQDTSSTGDLNIELGIEDSFRNRHIVIVEDIVDSGITMAWLTNELAQLGVGSITVVALLLKPDAIKHPVQIDKVGFEIPNDFVIGYGLDYNGRGRNLNGIFRLVGR